MEVGGERKETQGGRGHVQKFPGEPRDSTFRNRHGRPYQLSPKRPAVPERGRGRRWGRTSSPEHVVMAVYLLAHVGVVQDAPIAHHGTADAPGAPGREAGQEQLLLWHWGEACHHLLHHWNEEGPAVQSPGRARGLAPCFSRGWWPPGKRQRRDRKPATLGQGSVDARPPSPGQHSQE